MGKEPRGGCRAAYHFTRQAREPRYVHERHHAVFLFGRLRRWTRDRGRDLTHLSRATGAT